MELGCESAVDASGTTISVADTHRGDGKRFVVRADEKLTAFLKVEAAIRQIVDSPMGQGARDPLSSVPRAFPPAMDTARKITFS